MINKWKKFTKSAFNYLNINTLNKIQKFFQLFDWILTRFETRILIS